MAIVDLGEYLEVDLTEWEKKKSIPKSEPLLIEAVDVPVSVVNKGDVNSDIRKETSNKTLDSNFVQSRRKEIITRRNEIEDEIVSLENQKKDLDKEIEVLEYIETEYFKGD